MKMVLLRQEKRNIKNILQCIRDILYVCKANKNDKWRNNIVSGSGIVLSTGAAGWGDNFEKVLMILINLDWKSWARKRKKKQ